MSANYYDLLKYAQTGQASPDMTYFDKLRASTLMGGVVQTLTGIPPLSFKADGSPLISWSMKGNGSQSGTPTPDNPVMPTFCGERTGNLFDYYAYFNSTFTNYNQFFDYADLQLSANTTYTLSTSYTEVGTHPRNTSFIVAKPNDTPTTASGGISNISPITITTGSGGKLRLYKRISGACENPTKAQFDNGEWLMLNSGSTALPYEPYGWAEKITCAGQTTPVYLGEVPTVRRVKKLVLDGTEDWLIAASSDSNRTVCALRMPTCYENSGFCTHIEWKQQYQNTEYNRLVWNSNFGGTLYISLSNIYLSAQTEVAFKNYLASEYAAGHPVTIWHVLAASETAIVNEPLCKIGTYADELHSEDAGVSIPTIKGSNTLTVETELQPSEMSITYRG